MRLGGYAVLGLVLTGLCGCAGFKEPFKPEDAAWSGQKGANTVAFKAYAVNDREQWRCDDAVLDGSLLPDTPYYRDWIRIVVSPLRFKSSPSRKALSFVRHTKYQPGCLFVFRDVPAGKWLFVTNLEHHIAPHTTTVFYGSQGGTALKSSDLSEGDMIWGAVDVPAQTGVVARQVYEDYRKRRDVGMFRVHNFGRQAEVADWKPTEAEAKELGLDGTANATAPVHP